MIVCQTFDLHLQELMIDKPACIINFFNYSMMKRNFEFICTLFIIIFFMTNGLKAEEGYFDHFPVHAHPKAVGEKIAKRFLETDYMQLTKGRGIHYAEVCTWYGALRFAELTGDKELVRQLRNRFELLFHLEKKIVPQPVHVDQNMFGSLPLMLYRLTKDERYKELGMPYADTQYILPANANEDEREWDRKGYSWQTRLWIDDMYMITIVQKEAYLVTGNRQYINRAAKEMVMYLDKLQNKNGLFYHAPDVPYYWGRGDGWMAVGMTELLNCLPEDDPNRGRIMKGYRLMMKNLKKYVNRDGLWNQCIDQPDFWTETSGSAMFTYAMIMGVQNGWLDKEEFAPVARRAWLGLCNYLDDEYNLTEVCVATGKENSRKYYMDRPRMAGDKHGQAPMLWCAYALLKAEKVK